MFTCAQTLHHKTLEKNQDCSSEWLFTAVTPVDDRGFQPQSIAFFNTDKPQWFVLIGVQSIFLKHNFLLPKHDL